MDTNEMYEEEEFMNMMENLRQELAEIIKKHTGVDPEFRQKINEDSVLLTFSIAQDEEISMQYTLSNNT
ncbi:hypothetical protein HWQ17_10815 [Enterobacter pasteurii]|uniref:hypothetical protein n=1 Tax=Enterobacter pasteurii TaxID=3029761 RepID=UPI0011DD832B|nr:hypothetical protein [Enterobacter pasteurii]QLA68098.1 hypothetical protein HWQ17_10815 [Enterobacter pasteurii]